MLPPLARLACPVEVSGASPEPASPPSPQAAMSPPGATERLKAEVALEKAPLPPPPFILHCALSALPQLSLLLLAVIR